MNSNLRLYSAELSTRVAGPASLLLEHADGAVRTFAVEVLGAIAGSHVGYQAGPGLSWEGSRVGAVQGETSSARVESAWFQLSELTRRLRPGFAFKAN